MMTLVIKKGALSWILESQVSRAFYLKKTLKIALILATVTVVKIALMKPRLELYKPILLV